jgi:hypothetical protein
MPSNYTGNPIATQDPSPAPSWGNTAETDPIGSLPVNGDPPDGSTFEQAYKVPLDWCAFFRRELYGWTDISSDVTSSKGTKFGYKRKVGDMTVIVAGASGLTDYTVDTFTLTIGGSHLSATLIALATGQSSDGADEPFYAKAHETSGNETSRVLAVYHDEFAQGATVAVQVLILSS